MIQVPMTKEIKDRFKEMIKHAEENVVSLEQMKHAAENGCHPIGNDKNFVCDLYANCKIVFSHEVQPHPMNECKHVSISLITEADVALLKSTDEVVKIDTLPPPEFVQMIMLEFGFKLPLGHSIVWKENASENIEAINIIEPVLLEDTLQEFENEIKKGQGDNGN